jgi:hydrogenase nickel incorporation protein HypB
MKIKVIKDILEANDMVASGIRGRLEAAGARMVNVMGSPGSGKTCLLEKSISALRDRYRIGVIEGDIRTTIDSERLAPLDVPVVQVNTEPFGGDCHLPATAVERAIGGLDLDALDLVIVENVGNLVCPAEFDIGEHRKVVVLSVTEGEDKPLKYPLMFRESHAMVLSKLDLLPHLDLDLERVKTNALSVNPDLKLFPLSAKTGEGVEGWIDWLRAEIEGTG